jgi:carbonic anhydrase
MRLAGVPHPQTATDALEVLREGNERYRRGELELRDYSPVGERIAETQQPFAAIVTCADSRLSSTLIFDVHRGNLFVSRVAGNTVDAGTLGSTEFAVAVLGVKLIVVLGHSNCGAVNAAISVVEGRASYPAEKYGAIGAVVDAIVPAVRSVPPEQRTSELCIVANATAQASRLAETGPIVAPAVAAGDVLVVAAVYDIATGLVSFVS